MTKKEGSSPETAYGSVRRRDVLKNAAVAGLAVGGASDFAGAQTCESYETITVSPGERYSVSVGSGETLSNKLYDVSADNAHVHITATGTNWTIENVGIRGYQNRAEHDTFFGVADTGGNTSRMENIYIGDGAAGEQKVTGIWVSPDHSGHIDVVNVHMAGLSDNGIYASAPGYKGNGGTHHIHRCYGADNYTAQFRVGSDGDRITDCCAELTSSGWDGRGIWAWPEGPIDGVRDTDVQTRGRHYALWAGANDQPTTVYGYNFQYDADGGLVERFGSDVVLDSESGNDPEVFYPKGLPLDAEEAAGGCGSGSGRSGSTTGDAVYRGDATAVNAAHYDTSDRAGVEFTLTNDASQDLTVTGMTVTPQDTSIDGLHDEDDGIGRWISEIHLDADVQDGVCDVSGSASLPNTFDLSADGWSDDADVEAILSAGSSASVALSRFEASGTPVDMVGQSVDLEVDYELADGTTGSSSFTLDVAGSAGIGFGADATAVEATHYDTSDRAGVEFTLTNDASQDLTVTHVTVTPQDSSIDTLDDEDDGIGRWISEVHLDADVQDGLCDVSGSAALPTTFDLSADGWSDDADQVAVMSAGSSASVALGRFEASGTPVDMVGEFVDVDIDYELADGTTGTSSVTLDVGTGLSYQGDATAVNADHYDTSDRAGVEFTVTSTTGTEATITDVTVTPQDTSIDTLDDEDDGIGRWISEVHLDADVQDGVCDVSGSASLPNTFDLSADGWSDDADAEAILSAGSSASVALSRFEASGTPVDMVGKAVDVDVEVTFGGGTTGSTSFTLDPA